jgi:hypothetical protein
VKLREMDERVTYVQQLQQETGPVVLVNQFNVAPGDADRLLQAWADDAAFMRRRPASYRPRCTAASPGARRS